MSVEHIEPGVPLQQSAEHWMTLPDGQDLFYRLWAPIAGATKRDKALLLIHRGHEHSGRWSELAERFQRDGFWVVAPDLRGHGRSPGERGYAKSFATMVRDIDRFAHYVADQHNLALENMAVVAHSIGAVLAAAWIHDYAPPVRAMVLATAAFRVKLYVPFALPGLRLLQYVKKNAFLKSYVRARMLTHDERMARQYCDDPLISRDVAVNLLLGLNDASCRLLADAAAIRTPILVLAAGRDWVVRKAPQRRFFHDLGSETKEMITYDAFYHAIFHEQHRERPMQAAREFMQEVFHGRSEQPSLLDADQRGPSRVAYDRLRRPLPPFSAKRFYYALVKLTLKSVGRLSHGVSLGWQTGFNSGETLDYIYQNRTQGITPLGRLVDRIYLSSPGWQGIRRRKIHLKQLLGRALREMHSSGTPIRLLDIAAGPGRYVLEVLDELPGVGVTALLCDANKGALEAGRQLAAERGLAGIEYRKADAFDAESLATLDPRPNVAIVSGLFELFGANDQVLASLRGLGTAIEEDGYLIYTNQPWHPQLELIARALPGLDGRPWVMRCRSQAEMDQLAAAAGFEKEDMLIDDQGIFTVSLARRRGRQ